MKYWPAIIAPFLLVLLFAYTAASKFLEYGKFVFQMRLAPLPLMQSMAAWLGWLVPAVETGIVLLLLAGKTRRAGIIASLVLLSLFEVYILSMLATGLHLPCTCGGIISSMSWKTHLLFNLFFILLSVLALKKPPPEQKYYPRV